MDAGQIEPAITNYNKALELNPTSDNAKAMLAKLHTMQQSPQKP
jgi:hypothetical protein